LINLDSITATHINYYFICKRKLWLFSHQINLEQESDLVALGRVIHEESYDRKKKEIRLGNNMVLDHVDKERKILHEVKKSNKMEKAHAWQLKYYLYALQQFGVEGFRGKLDYPKLKRTVMVELTSQDVARLEEVEREIARIINQEIPEVKKTRACRKCAYYEFCFV